MIFDKIFIAHWANYPLNTNLVVFQEKDTQFLYLPGHARQEGVWSPFVSIDGDIAVFVEEQGEAEVIDESEKLIHLDSQGKLWPIAPEQVDILEVK
jgi:hypothetical protein